MAQQLLDYPQRFGKAVRLFAPLYLSNECNNVCDYCSFSMHNKIARKTLSDLEILASRYFKRIWLKACSFGNRESSIKVGLDYLVNALRILRPHFPIFRLKCNL